MSKLTFLRKLPPPILEFFLNSPETLTSSPYGCLEIGRVGVYLSGIFELFIIMTNPIAALALALEYVTLSLWYKG